MSNTIIVNGVEYEDCHDDPDKFKSFPWVIFTGVMYRPKPKPAERMYTEAEVMAMYRSGWWDGHEKRLENVKTALERLNP